MPRITAAYVPTRLTSVASTTAPAWRKTIATASTTAASENTSRNSSAYRMTSTLDDASPDSASTKKRAGSAPRARGRDRRGEVAAEAGAQRGAERELDAGGAARSSGS